MSNLKTIRTRIASVKNTQKITKAMKMVAAARLRRAQERVMKLRPYAKKTMEVLSSVAARVSDVSAQPLLAQRETKHVLLVILTSDRGLAGAFNASINKVAFKRVRELEAEGKTVSLATIGRKGRDFFVRRGFALRHEFKGVYEKLDLNQAERIAAVLVDDFKSEALDAVELIYNEFKSAITQKAVNERILPIAHEQAAADATDAGAEQDFIYEPSQTELLNRLLPMYVDIQVYRALLESVASEHGARMTAMDNASRNASEMIGKLTLQFNRARQAAITKELMEIIGGAEALKG